MAHQAKLFVPAFLALVALFCSTSATLAQNQQPANAPNQVQTRQIQTLATVNGQEVTRQEVAQQCMRRFGTDVLESIINKMLVFDECQRNGIVITEKDVNDDIVKSAKAFGMSGERYVKLICSRRNITEDRLKNEIVWTELALRRLAASQIQVTPDELNKRMEFEYGAKVQVREITVNTREKAEQLVQAAKADPASFERLAKDHSVNPNSAAMGGLLPPIRKNSDLPVFEQVAFSLQPGQVSDVFQVEDKFLILKCLRIFPQVELNNEQVTLTHERLVEEITNDKLRETAANLFRTLQASSNLVNVMNDEKLSREMPGVAAVVNGKNVLKNRVGEECIVRFGDMILETLINNKLLKQSLAQASLEVSPEDINGEIQRAAESLGHLNPDGTVNIDEWLTFVTANDPGKIDFYIEDEVWPTVALQKLVAERVNVTEDDMQKGFAANYGPRVDSLVIVSTDARQAQKVWSMATANPTEEYFGQLANQYSVEPASKANFGQVPPIQRFGGRPDLEKEAFGLKPGDISTVVQVGEYWVILYCRGQTTPKVTKMEIVKDELYKNILQKKMQLEMDEFFQRLRGDSQIDNYLTGTSQPGRAMVDQARTALGQGAGQDAGQRR